MNKVNKIFLTITLLLLSCLVGFSQVGESNSVINTKCDSLTGATVYEEVFLLDADNSLRCCYDSEGLKLDECPPLVDCSSLDDLTQECCDTISSGDCTMELVGTFDTNTQNDKFYFLSNSPASDGWGIGPINSGLANPPPTPGNYLYQWAQGNTFGGYTPVGDESVAILVDGDFTDALGNTQSFGGSGDNTWLYMNLADLTTTATDVRLTTPTSPNYVCSKDLDGEFIQSFNTGVGTIIDGNSGSHLQNQIDVNVNTIEPQPANMGGDNSQGIAPIFVFRNTSENDSIVCSKALNTLGKNDDRRDELLNEILLELNEDVLESVIDSCCGGGKLGFDFTNVDRVCTKINFDTNDNAFMAICPDGWSVQEFADALNQGNPNGAVFEANGDILTVVSGTAPESIWFVSPNPQVEIVQTGGGGCKPALATKECNSSAILEQLEQINENTCDTSVESNVICSSSNQTGLVLENGGTVDLVAGQELIVARLMDCRDNPQSFEVSVFTGGNLEVITDPVDAGVCPTDPVEPTEKGCVTDEKGNEWTVFENISGGGSFTYYLDDAGNIGSPSGNPANFTPCSDVTFTAQFLETQCWDSNNDGTFDTPVLLWFGSDKSLSIETIDGTVVPPTGNIDCCTCGGN